ncbi:MAG: hypothetical protein ABIH35_03665 [Patescibacteria group bacterium]
MDVDTLPANSKKEAEPFNQLKKLIRLLEEISRLQEKLLSAAGQHSNEKCRIRDIVFQLWREIWNWKTTFQDSDRNDRLALWNTTNQLFPLQRVMPDVLLIPIWDKDQVEKIKRVLELINESLIEATRCGADTRKEISEALPILKEAESEQSPKDPKPILPPSEFPQ